MIIEHVWDQSFQGLTNIVDVYVRHLREKVDDAFPVKLLRTVRGVGYSLNDEDAGMNTRSISFRLVAWYAGLLAGIFVLLCALLYLDLRHFLENDLRQSQARRARQIANTLLVACQTNRRVLSSPARRKTGMSRKSTTVSSASRAPTARWFMFPARPRTAVSIRRKFPFFRRRRKRNLRAS